MKTIGRIIHKISVLINGRLKNIGTENLRKGYSSPTLVGVLIRGLSLAQYVDREEGTKSVKLYF